VVTFGQGLSDRQACHRPSTSKAPSGEMLPSVLGYGLEDGRLKEVMVVEQHTEVASG
jgi:hypothetical protein